MLPYAAHGERVVADDGSVVLYQNEGPGKVPVLVVEGVGLEPFVELLDSAGEGGQLMPRAQPFDLH